MSTFIPKTRTSYEPMSLDSSMQIGNNSLINHTLLISPNAERKIKSHIGWGQKTKENIVEQGGILIGNVYQYNGKFYGVVKDSISARTNGNSVHVKFTHAIWEEMLKELDATNQRTGEKHIILGWYHTHPNDLNVFMSQTDRTAQAEQFSKDWQFALVINPHRQLNAAFRGKDCQPCDIVHSDYSLFKRKNVIKETTFIIRSRT